jgi:hypothetical protein
MASAAFQVQASMRRRSVCIEVHIDGLGLCAEGSDQPPDPCADHQWDADDPKESQREHGEHETETPDEDLGDALTDLTDDELPQAGDQNVRDDCKRLHWMFLSRIFETLKAWNISGNFANDRICEPVVTGIVTGAHFPLGKRNPALFLEATTTYSAGNRRCRPAINRGSSSGPYHSCR